MSDVATHQTSLLVPENSFCDPQFRPTWWTNIPSSAKPLVRLKSLNVLKKEKCFYRKLFPSNFASMRDSNCFCFIIWQAIREEDFSEHPEIIKATTNQQKLGCDKKDLIQILG